MSLKTQVLYSAQCEKMTHTWQVTGVPLCEVQRDKHQSWAEGKGVQSCWRHNFGQLASGTPRGSDSIVLNHQLSYWNHPLSVTIAKCPRQLTYEEKRLILAHQSFGSISGLNGCVSWGLW